MRRSGRQAARLDSFRLFALCLLSEGERPAGADSRLHNLFKWRRFHRQEAARSKEQTIRGFSGVKLLAIDEAARVPDELYFAIRPMLAVSKGRLVALSTPFGTRGWFYEAWRSSEAWERFEVPATDCPRISPEFLEEESRTIGAWWFAQEYGCQFMDAETQPFRREDVERAFEEEVQAWAL